MRFAKPRRGWLRALRVERCEDRLLMSAQPVGENLIEAATADWFQVESLNRSPATEMAGDLKEQSAPQANYLHSQYQLTGQGQTVAVIDSGIAYDHDALGGGFGTGYRVVGGWDFTEENDADPYDDAPAGFHGTHVAGIIGSSDAQHRGVAPDVDLVSLRVFNDQGQSSIEWVEQALQWVHANRNSFENPITTVNLSLAINSQTEKSNGWTAINDELAILESDGIFIAVAAGNSFQVADPAVLSYPGESPYVVPVASMSITGEMSDFSQRSDRVIVAVGEYITSTVPDAVFDFDGIPNDFGTASGTSMASPYVAGASVLIRQAMQDAGYDQISQSTIYDVMRATADMIDDPVTLRSYHRLNLVAAIESIQDVKNDAEYISFHASNFEEPGEYSLHTETTENSVRPEQLREHGSKTEPYNAIFSKTERKTAPDQGSPLDSAADYSIECGMANSASIERAITPINKAAVSQTVEPQVPHRAKSSSDSITDAPVRRTHTITEDASADDRLQLSRTLSVHVSGDATVRGLKRMTNEGAVATLSAENPRDFVARNWRNAASHFQNILLVDNGEPAAIQNNLDFDFPGDGGLAVDSIHRGENLESSMNSTNMAATCRVTDELFGQVDDWQLAAIYS